METIRLDTSTREGRRVAVWRSRPDTIAPVDRRGLVVVMCPGFGRQMTDLVTVAAYLTANGATVYRLDPLDHVGLSDGTILDYSPSASAASLEAVVRLVNAAEHGRHVTLVAASMSARPALRVALEGGVDRLVTVVGVVHMRRTIASVFGDSIVELDRSDLPSSVWFEDLEVGPYGIYDDRRFGWWDLETTTDELTRLQVPATAVFADADPWVDAHDVRAAFGRRRDRHLVPIRSRCHDLGQDPAAGFVALEAITAAALGSPSLVVPTLEQLGRAISAERVFHAAQLAWALDSVAVPA